MAGMGIKEIVIGATVKGALHSEMKFTRRAVNAFAQQLRDHAGTLDLLAGMASLEEALDTCLAAHISPEDAKSGRAGTFDVCDLRHWLAIAERADVPFIPAREILTLEADEIGALTGPVKVPGHFKSAILRRLRKVLGDLPAPTGHQAPGADRDAVVEKIFAAGDLIPPGHVVRSAICGPNTMKALAGTGTLSHSDDAARFGGIEIGCGWVREGNRTRIDVTDKRMLDLQARGHEDTFRFLVRPWIDAARRNEGEDPHFVGTPLAATRSWPAEWRVYVQNGQVIGVGNYYGWCGEATPAAARGALAAKAAAEKMIAVLQRDAILPLFSDLYLMNFGMARSAETAHPDAVAQALDVSARFPMDGIHCTLDFIETGDGEVMLLEGGPAHTPIGGGHPTAFSGCLAIPGNPMFTDIRGVAFRAPDDVIMPEPETWTLREPDHAMDFESVAELAALDRGMELQPGMDP